MSDQVEFTEMFAKVVNGKVKRATIMPTSPLGSRYDLTVGEFVVHDISEANLWEILPLLGFDPTTPQTFAVFCEDHERYENI